MKPLRIVFWGTPDLGIPVLRAMHASPLCDVVAVVSQPDKPQGRKQELLPTPIKQCALDLGITVLQPEKLQSPEVLATLQSFDADYFVVMAYGKIVKQEVLDIPKIAPVNIHVSLLPHHRGASPIQASLLAGDKVTGVTFMRMTAGMDEGPILAQKQLEIAETWHAGDVFQKLARLSSEHIVDVLTQYSEGLLAEIAQNDAEATHCRKISKEMGEIHWKQTDTEEIYRTWQAYTPWPGIFTFLEGRRIKLLHVSPAKMNHLEKHVPGEISLQDGRVYVAARDGVLELLTMQTEGKKPTAAQDWIRGIKQMHFDADSSRLAG